MLDYILKLRVHSRVNEFSTSLSRYTYMMRTWEINDVYYVNMDKHSNLAFICIYVTARQTYEEASNCFTMIKKILTKHSHVWHWYTHLSPLWNTTWCSSWWRQSLAASHCGQQAGGAEPRAPRTPPAPQRHATGAHADTPLEQLHVRQPPASTHSRPSDISLPSCMQPRIDK